MCIVTLSGAVLVFLPGLGSILDVFQGLLDNHPDLMGHLKLFALHSIIPMSEQQEVFEPVEAGNTHMNWSAVVLPCG